MLVIRDHIDRSRGSDDSGAVLITALVVFLVGFMISISIDGTVIFTIQSNATNDGRGQAFIAAESGRDAAIAAIAAGACTVTGTGTDPQYTFALKSTQGDQPTSFTEAGLTSTCPTADSRFVVVESTGTAPDGATATVTATYPWQVFYPGQPGGTMAYFDGQFTATQSSYAGDLVVRSGDYNCNSTSTITGDLWLPTGTLYLSADCTIDGSVYARDGVYITAAKAKVTGSIFAGGIVSITGNNTTIGHDVVANSSITINNKTTVGGDVKAGTTATVTATITGTVTQGLGTPAVFDPDLGRVFDMTKWLDLPVDRATYGSNVQWVLGPCDGSNIMTAATMALSGGATRVGVDYTACTGPVTVKLTGGPVQHDVLFLVPPTSRMSIAVTGSLTSLTIPQPQLFFIHGDAVLGNQQPDCVTGSSTDGLSLPSTVQVRMMLYTACGLGSTNGMSFNGQFYANYDGDAHWVHPAFTCQNMTWAPILGLSCKVSDAAANQPEPPPPVEQLGPLVTQRER
jgi:hypothetical protein